MTRKIYLNFPPLKFPKSKIYVYTDQAIVEYSTMSKQRGDRIIIDNVDAEIIIILIYPIRWIKLNNVPIKSTYIYQLINYIILELENVR